MICEYIQDMARKPQLAESVLQTPFSAPDIPFERIYNISYALVWYILYLLKHITKDIGVFFAIEWESLFI